MSTETISIKNPTLNQGAAIWELVRRCPPLDLNSPYLYLLLCLHHARTCLVAEKDSRIVGFVSSYSPPGESDVIFVWQIAVDDSVRGQGLGKKLLHRLIQLDVYRDTRYLTCTVSPSNDASRRLFQSFSREVCVKFKQTPLLSSELFPDAVAHEEEALIQLGPIR